MQTKVFNPSNFHGFDFMTKGSFAQLSTAVAAVHVVNNNPLLVAVDANTFLFRDEVGAALNTDYRVFPNPTISKLSSFCSDMSAGKTPDPVLSKQLEIFCRELTWAPHPYLVGSEARVVFLRGLTPVLEIYLKRELKESIMHEASQRLMNEALFRFIPTGEEVKVLDVGSYDVNGTYKPHVLDHGWSYTGLDVRPGPNVDVVADNPYHYPFETGEFDIVITGSVAYTVLDLVQWMQEITRLVKPGGLLVIVTPSYAKPPAQAPDDDYWRMSVNALRALMDNTGLLTGIEVEQHHMDVVGSAVRIAGLIDEPPAALNNHAWEGKYMEPVSGESDPETVSHTVERTAVSQPRRAGKTTQAKNNAKNAMANKTVKSKTGK